MSFENALIHLFWLLRTFQTNPRTKAILIILINFRFVNWSTSPKEFEQIWEVKEKKEVKVWICWMNLKSKDALFSLVWIKSDAGQSEAKPLARSLCNKTNIFTYRWERKFEGISLFIWILCWTWRRNALRLRERERDHWLLSIAKFF